jgi:hypothetical protein
MVKLATQVRRGDWLRFYDLELFALFKEYEHEKTRIIDVIKPDITLQDTILADKAPRIDILYTVSTLDSNHEDSKALWKRVLKVSKDKNVSLVFTHWDALSNAERSNIEELLDTYLQISHKAQVSVHVFVVESFEIDQIKYVWNRIKSRSSTFNAEHVQDNFNEYKEWSLFATNCYPIVSQYRHSRDTQLDTELIQDLNAMRNDTEYKDCVISLLVMNGSKNVEVRCSAHKFILACRLWQQYPIYSQSVITTYDIDEELVQAILDSLLEFVYTSQITYELTQPMKSILSSIASDLSCKQLLRYLQGTLTPLETFISLRDTLHTLYTNDTHVDLYLQFDHARWGVHRALLKHRSWYFCAIMQRLIPGEFCDVDYDPETRILKLSFDECQDPEHDFSQLAVEYMYCGSYYCEDQIDAQNWFFVLCIAHPLSLRGLVDQCEKVVLESIQDREQIMSMYSLIDDREYNFKMLPKWLPRILGTFAAKSYKLT